MARAGQLAYQRARALVPSLSNSQCPAPRRGSSGLTWVRSPCIFPLGPISRTHMLGLREAGSLLPRQWGLQSRCPAAATREQPGLRAIHVESPARTPTVASRRPQARGSPRGPRPPAWKCPLCTRHPRSGAEHSVLIHASLLPPAGSGKPRRAPRSFRRGAWRSLRPWGSLATHPRP